MSLNYNIDAEGDALILAITKAIQAAEAHEFPALVVETVTDDGETYEAIRCPRCGQLVTDDEDSLRAVDWSQHWQPAGDSSVEGRTISFSADDTDLSDTVYYQHEGPDGYHAVSLPEGFKEEWN